MSVCCGELERRARCENFACKTSNIEVVPISRHDAGTRIYGGCLPRYKGTYLTSGRATKLSPHHLSVPSHLIRVGEANNLEFQIIRATKFWIEFDVSHADKARSIIHTRLKIILLVFYFILNFLSFSRR